MEEQNLKKPTVMQVGLVFSIAIILFLYLGSRAQSWDFNGGILITEFILILGPPVVFLFLMHFDIRRVLRLNTPKLSNLFLIFWIMLFSIPVVAGINLLNLWLIKTVFGKIEVPQIPVGGTIPELIISIFVIAVSAGICEEVLFRGVIIRGFERFGTSKSILFTAILFGLMHIDLQKIFATIALGVLIGFLVVRTNSLISGIFAHFLNNALATVLSYNATKASENLEKSGLTVPSGGDVFEMYADLPMVQIIVIIATGLVMYAVSAIILSLLIKAFVRNTADQTVPMPIQREKSRFSFLSLAGVIPGLLFIAFMYVAQGLLMKGIVTLDTMIQIYEYIGLK